MNKLRFGASLALCLLALILLPETLMYPDAGFFVPGIIIPLLSGVFLRSVIVGLFFVAAWVYRYGFEWTAILGYAYWGVGGLTFNLLTAIVWGGNIPLNFLTLLSYGVSIPDFILRIVVLPTATLSTFIFKLYAVSPYSVALGIAWVGFIVIGAALLPHSYLLGEAQIPGKLLPQLYEFLSLVVSFLFAYSFFRPFGWGKK